MHKNTNRFVAKLDSKFLLALMTVFIIPILFFVSDTHATASSINLSIVSGTEDRSIDIAPNISGKFVASTNTTAKVISNHAAGYVLTATATPLSFEDTSTSPSAIRTIDPLSSGTSINASTFSNENNTQYNNKWGYKPSQYYNGTSIVDNTTSNTQYFFPAPINTTQIIDSTNNTTTSSGTTYDIAIGARIAIDSNDPVAPGSYTSTFTFAVVGNLTPYSITYNQNTQDTVTNMPTPNPLAGNADQSTSTVTLSSTVPIRNGYNFKGWCSTITSNDACSGIIYNPDGNGTDLTLTIDQTSTTNTYNLYAMWKNSDPCLGLTGLYDLVACRSKGTQTATGIKYGITIPTSANWVEDTSNSGVYEYDPSVFGAANDAANSYSIYYYRGVLENSVGSYGSSGSAVTYPNYVVLSSASSKSGLTTTDTCWRIVRTTGSGGIKMIYNGKWTGSTCANATTNAQVTTSAYNGTSSTYRRIALVGYTYNPTYGNADVTTSTSVNTVFGSNSNYSVNSSNSTMKTYIENTWFSNIGAYESILEPSAGYCNDRTAYSTSSASTTLSTIEPYSYSRDSVFFGAYGRNVNAYFANKRPSLTCPSERNIVDLYTTSSATSGNKQLSKPAALLTADEVSFAGSGRSNSEQGSATHAKSFLDSGSDFWLLSPGFRDSDGYACGFGLYSLFHYLVYSYYINDAYGVRPAISLKSGTTVASGSGIATDPWIVSAP